jgi:hypothetical protein
MKNGTNTKVALSIAVSIFLTLILSFNADAYIDPNTGGFFFTSVLPFVYGILGVVVVFWKKIFNFLRNLFSKKKSGDDN